MKNTSKPLRVVCIIIMVCITSSFINVDSPNKVDTSVNALVTDGLYFAEFYDLVYRGHFEQLDIRRDETLFLSIYESYLYAFGRQCASSLPANKVEMLKQVCKTERVTTDGFGVETDRHCVQSEWVGSGVFAKPDLYYTKVEVQKELVANGLIEVMQDFMSPNGMGNTVDMIHKAQGLKGDMQRFFKLNEPNSNALLAFEENLKHYARNEPSVRIAEESPYVKMKNEGGPATPQNHKKLLDDLIKDQSKTWAMNRYVPGSITAINARKRPDRKLAVVTGRYTFKGLLGTQQNNVRVTFKNGLPECIYFSDYPNNCKSPNSSIISSFSKGNYKQQ